MDKLIEHGIRMLEIVEGENDFYRNDAKRQADIARAVYDIILRVQTLERKADRKTEPQSVTYNPTSVNNIWEKPTNPYVPNEQTEPTISKMEQVDKDINVRSKDEPKTEDDKKHCVFCKWVYEPNVCGRCRNMNLFADAIEDEPQTCSFSDCDNFKNPDYERCIECKRKQIKLKTEQTEREGE